jgi:hypothetical protein
MGDTSIRNDENVADALVVSFAMIMRVNSCQVVFRTRSGAGSDAMALQNVGNCVAGYFMAQIRQCSPHSEVTPTPIFFRHPNDPFFNLLSHRRP